MPTEYSVDNPLADNDVRAIVHRALPDKTVVDSKRVGHGSTNLIYQIKTSTGPLILKISHRPDRIAGQILAKEARILRLLNERSWSIAIPKVLWEGFTPDDHPALLMTHLPGQHIRPLLEAGTDASAAMVALGAWNAQLNAIRHSQIDEFEADRPQFERFADCVEHWLSAWQPLHDQAEPHHVTQAQLANARARIRQQLSWFDDADWAYVHSDLSAENVLGEVRDGQLILTGICDFETVQTGPPEYDLGSAWNNYFVYHPQLEEPFMAGYTSVQPLHPHWQERLVAASLFRALRYIKRSVKYKETHYYDHDRAFLLAWLNR